MTLYISKLDSWSYQLLDKDGEPFGKLKQYDRRKGWEYFPLHTPPRVQRLSRNLKSALEQIDPGATWKEQITIFEEVK